MVGTDVPRVVFLKRWLTSLMSRVVLHTGLD